jgi:hypothetical protein
LSVELAKEEEMRRWTLPLVLACGMLNAGCMTTQLRNQMNEQASTIPDVYYQQVLNNLAMIVAEPARLPYFSDPQTSRVSIARTANGSYGINYDLITSAPTGVLTLFNRWMLDRQSATLTGGQTDTGQWAALTSNDPDKLFSMRAIYRKAAGTATSEDEELLTEFYYRHFQITDEALLRLRENRPEVYKAIGEKLEKLRDMEFLTVESFENRLAKPDVLGPDDVVRYRRPVLKFARMENEPTEFVSDEDTHHLLYLPAVKPGWFAVGGKDDVPKHACYIGRYCNTYVWVPKSRGRRPEAYIGRAPNSIVPRPGGKRRGRAAPRYIGRGPSLRSKGLGGQTRD